MGGGLYRDAPLPPGGGQRPSPARDREWLVFCYRVQGGKSFGDRRSQKMAVGASEEDLQSFLVQKQSAREMDGIGAPERMARAEPGHQLEHRSSDRYLLELLPIVGEVQQELLKLGARHKLFSSSASERRVNFGEGQDRNSHRPSLPGSLAHSLRARLSDIEFDQRAGVEKKDQRRSSLIISEASLPRFGTVAP